MTNETTASQPKCAACGAKPGERCRTRSDDQCDAGKHVVSKPKSIGDDALEELVREYGNVPLIDGNKRGFRLRKHVMADILTLIDSRAPAAQASAPKAGVMPDTAQLGEYALFWAQKMGWSTASEDSVWDFITGRCAALGTVQASAPIQAALDLSKLERFGMDTEYDYHTIRPRTWGEYVRLSDVTALLAATIQEPVMVAEPVGCAECDGEGTVCNGELDVAPCPKCQDVEDAAPMVADPAGVNALIDSIESGLGEIVTASHSGLSGTAANVRYVAEELEKEIDAYREAATVKAVPSEALTDAQRERIRDGLSIALGGAMDCTRVWSAWGIGTMSEDDFQLLADNDERLDELVDAVAANFATPLAGKTGGGE